MPEGRRGRALLINGGADVLFQNTDSSAVLQKAEEKGTLAFGWDSDMSVRPELASGLGGKNQLDALLQQGGHDDA